MKPKLALDPGHGGYDPGAVGNDLLEKDITLAICLQLKILLEFNGITVMLTRDGDYAPGHLENQLNKELNYRSTLSNNFGADLFVSVHINSGGGTGEETLVYGLGGNGAIAANKILARLQEVDGWADRGVVVQNVSVLSNKTLAPATLTENGFIDSVSDTNKLKDPNFIHALVVAHAKGICDYFNIVYKDNVIPIRGVIVLDVAVAYFTGSDQSVALSVANLLGGCATFCRNGGQTVHPDAMNSKKLFNIGGPKLGHPNEIYMSGQDSMGTIAEVVKKYQSGEIK